MSTQNQIQLMIDGLVTQGLPITHAVALSTAIEHALTSEQYAAQYGTFMVDALHEMIEGALA